MTSRIVFIGAGNMAQALIGGLLNQGHPNTQISAIDPDPTVRAQVKDDYGIAVESDHGHRVPAADIVLLAVKPQLIGPVMANLSNHLTSNHLLISVAAGVSVEQLQSLSCCELAIVRAMPNTPALLGQGATGLFAGPGCSTEQVEQARSIFAAVGRVAMIEDQALMNVVTAVSGSGPAYFFALTEALQKAAEHSGLPSDVARLLAQQTAAGAGAMLGQPGASATRLRQQVTSPGGTTAAALDAFSLANFDQVVLSAVEAAIQRGQSLTQTDRTHSA